MRAHLLADGGPDISHRFIAELRRIRIDHDPPPDGVLSELDAAYERAAAQPSQVQG